MTTATQAKPAAVATVPAAGERQGLVQWAGQKFGVDAGKVFPILKQTCFKAGDREASDAEVAALMIVAREHGLNPFLKEIYAFPDKKGGIVPVVGVDGWIRIINSHPEFNGMEFEYEKTDSSPAWIECHIFRKDREHPIVVREFLSECKRDTQPWKSHPSRMLRHKTLIQCARVAFGFAGIFDPDEAEGIIEGQVVHEQAQPGQQPQRGAAALKNALVGDGLNVDQPSNAAPQAPDSGASNGYSRDNAATSAPVTSKPAGAAPTKKPAGTAELLEKYLAKFKESNDPDVLSLTFDETRMYEWADADRQALAVAYDNRLTHLESQ